MELCQRDSCKCCPLSRQPRVLIWVLHGWAVLCWWACSFTPGPVLHTHWSMPGFHPCVKEVLLHLGKFGWGPAHKACWGPDHEHNIDTTFVRSDCALLFPVLQRCPSRCPVSHTMPQLPTCLILGLSPLKAGLGGLCLAGCCEEMWCV